MLPDFAAFVSSAFAVVRALGTVSGMWDIVTWHNGTLAIAWWFFIVLVVVLIAAGGSAAARR